MATFRYSGPNGESYKIEAATEADAMAVLAEAGISDEPPPETSMLESGLRGAKQGFMGGFGDELQAAAAASPIPGRNPNQTVPTFNAVDALAGGARILTDKIGLTSGEGAKAYEAELARQRAADKKAAADNPITYGVGAVAGGVANPVMRAGGPGMAGGAKSGALTGAIYGVGEGEDLEGRLTGGLTGGAVGGVVGGAVGAATSKIADAMAARSAARMAAPPVAAAVNEGVEAGGRMGVPVPRFLATDNTAVRSGAQVARNAPIGGAAIDDAGTQFLDDVGGAARRVGNMASSGGVLKDRATIGGNIRTTVLDKIDDMDADASGAYKLLRAAINPDKPVDVTAKVSPLLNSIMKMRQAAGETPLGGHLDTVAELMTRPGGVTFNGLQRARSQIGKAINWDARNEGMAVGDLKRLQGSLTDALEQAARLSAKNQNRAGRAVNLLKAADRRYADTAETTSALARMFDPKNKVADEAIVDRLLKMASDKAGGNIKQLRSLKATIGQDNIADLSGYVIDRMGRNNAGEFSGAIFASNLEKMAPAARREIFSDPRIYGAVNDLRTLSDVWKRADAFSNKSQTGRTTGMVALGAGLIADPVTAIASALGARTFASIMSRPATAQSLGQWAKTTAKLQGGLEKGTIGSTRAFEKMSRVYAGKIGAEMGVPANDVARALIGSVRSAAEGEQQKRAE